MEIGDNIWSLIPVVSSLYFPIVKVSSAATTCLNRLTTRADVYPFVSHRVVQAYYVFSGFSWSSNCAVSGTASFTGLYSNNFRNKSENFVQRFYVPHIFFRRWTRHSARGQLRQFIYLLKDDTCLVCLCKLFRSPLIVLVPSEPEKRILVLSIFFLMKHIL